MKNIINDIDYNNNWRQSPLSPALHGDIIFNSKGCYMKTCFQCGFEKPHSNFFKIPDSDNYRKNRNHKQICKQCIELNREKKKKKTEPRTKICWLEKTCYKCKETKSIYDFYKLHNKPDGHQFSCKECAKKHSLENKEKQIEHSKKYYYKKRENTLPKRRFKSKEEITRQKEIKKIKDKARTTLRAAVKANKISKPEHCSLCNKKLAKCKIHAHHESYLNSLDVIWCCQECHMLIHRDEDVVNNGVKEILTFLCHD